MSLHATSPRLAFAGTQMAVVCALGGLFFLFLDFHGFKVLGLEDLMAIETFHVVHAISSSDHLGARVVTLGLHKANV
jgi:hypothetical protein